jgi:site-specific recombinase XerD
MHRDQFNTRPKPTRAKPKRRMPPEILSHDEANALLAACEGESSTALRNRALIALMYRAGLRISEALQVRPKDADLDHGVVRVLFGKGGRYRAVGIDPAGAEIIRAWSQRRSELRIAPSAPLLCTLKGTTVTDAYVRRLLPKLAARAGILKRVHAHGLRHTHAAQLRSEGVDIGLISKQLGHASITTTARYLDHIQPTAVIDAMRRRTWA